MAKTNKVKKKTKNKKLSIEERRHRKVQTDHTRSVRTVFRNMGFVRVNEIAGTEVVFGGRVGEFDDAFMYENVILLVEYTTSQSSDVPSHLKNKKIIFSNVQQDPRGFIEYFKTRSNEFRERINDRFHIDKYILKIVYCSRFDFDETVKHLVDEPVYLDFPMLKYFEKISGTIKVSALNEMLGLLGIDPLKVARDGKIAQESQSGHYKGSILPESSSGFPPGYKVVSFYADAASLLSRAYVLRRDGWRGSGQAYQRMLISSKIEEIRKKLKSEKRVFVNNLVATLPLDTRCENEDGTTINIADLSQTEPVIIRLPSKPNSIGLIDGQHRLYSYYETKEDDLKIAQLRSEQNLLVTGVVYPENTTEAQAERFAAELFLTINAHQTNAPASLRQEIEVFLKPSNPTAIGRRVMQELAASGPLAGHVEKHFFDKGKLKTSSIVSYGLGPLIKLSGEDSLFKVFPHPEKDKIAKGESDSGLVDYVKFAKTQINTFLGAVKSNVDSARWTPDNRVKDRLLSVTYINSFLITLRFLIRDGKEINFESLKNNLNGIDRFKFREFHSSQYNRMAEQIYKEYFDTT